MGVIHHWTGPKAYLEPRPTHQTIRLAGRSINAAKLAYDKALSHSYVTRILSGERTPSVNYLKTIAAALCMECDELLEAIRDRKMERDTERQRRVMRRA